MILKQGFSSRAKNFLRQGSIVQGQKFFEAQAIVQLFEIRLYIVQKQKLFEARLYSSGPKFF
jgi:uncharacterized protein YkuJ